MKTHWMTSSAVLALLLTPALVSADWTRFRGPDGTGISDDTQVPVYWSDTNNLKWATPLPGPGSSSPIVVGDRVFVTCYSGKAESLRRHLVCVHRANGKMLWMRAVAAEQPEDVYEGYLTQHGYASNSPVTDGQHVYVFFGKTGVLCFDLDGTQVWQVNVGRESSNRRWGSAASLVLYQDTVIVNASEESNSIRALNKNTGEEVWKAAGAALELAYGTPTLVHQDEGHAEIVVGLPGEVWSLNAKTGKLIWYAETALTGNVCPSVVADDAGVVYVFGGYRSSGSHAIQTGGKGDVTDSHMIWSSKHSSYVATPLLHNGHLYWVDDRGQAFCVQANSGELVYRERLSSLTDGGRPVYASPVLCDGKLYVVSRWSGTFVFAAQPTFAQIAQNRFASDDSDFSGTPAMSDGELFLRSNKSLYCINNKEAP